jgi:hypothetical protein
MGCFAEAQLTDPAYIREYLTNPAYWGKLHGARGGDLGAGMLYYGLVYAMKAKVCVCLGSGDGFVPRAMRQAQRDLQLADAETILVDCNCGNRGRPQWLLETSVFKQEFPEIKIILDKTCNVARKEATEWKIDYLHIDADRTIEGAFQDFVDYLPFVEKGGIISLHDTGSGRPCSHVVERIRQLGYPVINIENLGTGLALIYIQ